MCIRRQHFFMVTLKTAFKNQLPLHGCDLVKIIRSQQGQQRIAYLALGKLPRVIFQLIQQYRNKIECGTGGWISLQVIRHIGVILDGVEIGPWQHKLTSQYVPIIGLVHVPVKIEVKLGFYRHVLKEPLIKSHMAATTALRDEMQGRRQLMAIPLARGLTPQIVRKAVVSLKGCVKNERSRRCTPWLCTSSTTCVVRLAII